LAEVAPHCDRYIATDVSAAAVAGLTRALRQVPWQDRVELRTQPAHVTDGLSPGSFDTVVLNSIVQYFPTKAYLAEVLDRAVELLTDGGTLFIGDVRNHT